MNVRVTLILTGLLLGTTGRVSAQEIDRTAPYIKVSCSVPSVRITVEPLAPVSGQIIEVEGKPVQLEKGAQYVLAVTKTGYQPYRKAFTAEWQGLREKSVAMERGIGPVGGEIWDADLEDGVQMKFVPIPVGEFMMGSNEGEEDERPVHRVEFKRSFWMAETEVTTQQYDQYHQHVELYLVASQKNKSFEEKKKLEKNEIPIPQGAMFPVSYVSWQDAMSFCKWLTKKERRRGRLPEGYEYTLPTEAEWEYACRAGSTGDFAGNVVSMAWHVKNSGERSNPVGKKKPNAWGLYDMHGNVWEWCTDDWYTSYVHAPVNGSQRGDAPGEYRVDNSRVDDPGNRHRWRNKNYKVVRGGGWSYPLSDCRSANRFYHALKDHDEKSKYLLNYLGFRPVLVWNPPVPELRTTNILSGEGE